MSDGDVVITEIDQWEKRRQDIVSRLYSTIGTPPAPRNTRAIETLNDHSFPQYARGLAYSWLNRFLQ